MDCTRTTSSARLLVSLIITAILPVVWSSSKCIYHPFTSHTKGGLENVANVLISETGKLCSEICKTPNLCDSSAEHFLRIDLKLPEIDVESGCLSTNFNKEKCLPKIYSDLLKFQTYLDFLKESMSSNKVIVEFLQVKSISLADTVLRLQKNPSEVKEETTTGVTVADLRSKDPWSQNLTSYIILQSFQEYLEKTARAVRNSTK